MGYTDMERVCNMDGAALVLVDVQRDFLPGGSLAVPEGDQIVSVINELMGKFAEDKIISTKDSHPVGHGSFASAHDAEPFTMGELGGRPQMMWPDHCVSSTIGWMLAEDLDKKALVCVILKGEDKNVDSYSGFADDGGAETALMTTLIDLGLKCGDTIYMCGLATDYCVKATAIDGKAKGFNVRVVLDASRGVAPETTMAALKEMRDAGIEFVNSDDLDKLIDPVE